MLGLNHHSSFVNQIVNQNYWTQLYLAIYLMQRTSRTLEWVEGSCLCVRVSSPKDVTVDGSKSPNPNVPLGVPQGSVPGLLLLILYTSSSVAGLPCLNIAYAVDTTIYIIPKPSDWVTELKDLMGSIWISCLFTASVLFGNWFWTRPSPKAWP